jgi:hypothetical protein
MYHLFKAEAPVCQVQMPHCSRTADIHHGSGVRKRRRGEGLFWGPCARPTAKWPV